MNTGKDKRFGFGQVLLLTLAGLFSGLLTIFISYTNARFPAQFFLGMPFGVLISGCLAALGVVCSVWRVIRLIAVATMAYFLSFLVAYAFQGAVLSPFMSSSAQSSFSPIAMFVGGIVGSFLVFSEAAFLPRIENKQRVLKLALLWSSVGGALGAAGEQFGSTLGAVLLLLVRDLHLASLTNVPSDVLNGSENTQRLFSLFIVWQTGMAFLIGFILRRYEAKPPR